MKTGPVAVPPLVTAAGQPSIIKNKQGIVRIAREGGLLFRNFVNINQIDGTLEYNVNTVYITMAIWISS